MQAQPFSNTVRLVVVVVLPLLVMAACDTVEPEPEPVPRARSATVSFDATANWPSYGEDIRALGTQSIRYRSVQNSSGDYEVLAQSEALDADFTGLASGDSYEYRFANAVREWAAFGAPAGSEEYFTETIMLMNERTNEAGEGIVVTKATIGTRGEVSFEVMEIVGLP